MKLRFLAALCCGIILTSSSALGMMCGGCACLSSQLAYAVGTVVVEPLVAKAAQAGLTALETKYPADFQKFVSVCHTLNTVAQSGYAAFNTADALSGGVLSAGATALLQAYGLLGAASAVKTDVAAAVQAYTAIQKVIPQQTAQVTQSGAAPAPQASTFTTITHAAATALGNIIAIEGSVKTSMTNAPH